MRDPTRGGLASALNEIAAQSRVGIELEESAIPVREAVRGACEMLGLDPLYVANEGKLVAIVPPDAADAVRRGHAPPSAGRGRRHHRHRHRARPRPGDHAHGLRHHPHRRHAGRRPVAEDLLMPC